jgi:hypothetical protein
LAAICMTMFSFPSRITQHIPERLAQMVRYYGWYSNRMRKLPMTITLLFSLSFPGKLSKQIDPLSGSLKISRKGDVLVADCKTPPSLVPCAEDVRHPNLPA